MRVIILVLAATTAMILAAGCGDGGQEDSVTSAATVSPAPSTPSTATPARGPIAPSELCRRSQGPLPSYNVQLTARWEGKDRIVIEGSANLPGPGSVTYLVCQDGEVSSYLRWVHEPTFEDGKIQAESKLIDAQVGPAFDPEAHFEVVLSVLGDPVQVPYFTIGVPVEGKPD